MIKGARKQMIVIRTGNSPYFDEAYFVLRKDIQEYPVQKKDIISEANRILEESAAETQKRGRWRRSRWLFFGAGTVAGGAAGGLILLLILL